MKTGNPAVHQFLVKLHSLIGSNIICTTKGNNEATAACGNAWTPNGACTTAHHLRLLHSRCVLPSNHGVTHLLTSARMHPDCVILFGVLTLIQAIMTLEHSVMLTLTCMLLLKEEPENITARTGLEPAPH